MTLKLARRSINTVEQFITETWRARLREPSYEGKRIEAFVGPDETK